MKRQLSLLMLAARSSLWRVLGILAAMAAAQTAVFAVQMDGATLEALLDGRLFRLAAALGLAGTAAAVSLSSGGFGSRVDYRAALLPVSPGAPARWHALYGLAAALLAWGVQLGVVLALCRLYAGRVGAGDFTGQLTVLAAYRSSLFHTLLPLADGVRWAATACYYAGLGLSMGLGAVRAWSGRWAAGPLVLALAFWFQPGGLGAWGWQILLGVSALGVACKGLWYFVGEEEAGT